MKYTQYYQLPQWEKSDRIVMEDFNDMTAKVEAGLVGKAELVTGTYAGNGASSRTITLGFQPKVLYLCSQGGLAGYLSGYYYVCGGLALPGHPIVDQGNNNAVAVEITATGFQLHQDSYRQVNENGWVYFYLALR